MVYLMVTSGTILGNHCAIGSTDSPMFISEFDDAHATKGIAWGSRIDKTQWKRWGKQRGCW